MTEMEQLEADLGYVRQAVQKSDGGRSVAAIHLLWAVLVPIGFALMDFAPQYVPVYWTFAGPAGFVVSGGLGWRAAVARGQLSHREGRHEALHWGATMGVIFLSVPLVATGRVGQDEFGMFITLVLALSYFLAGVHAERPLLAVGVVLMLGYASLWFVPAYRWTFIGALASGALIVTALVSRAPEARAGASTEAADG
jgi:hypothetical protein